MIIKVFGHFPRRSRRGSWWHSCIPKHGGGNYNEAPIHSSDHKVCTWHRFRDGQAVVERGRLWPSLLQCRQCTLIYLGNHRKQWAQPNICFHRSLSGGGHPFTAAQERQTDQFYGWNLPSAWLPISQNTLYTYKKKIFKRLKILRSVTSLTSLFLQCMYMCTPWQNNYLIYFFIFIFMYVCMYVWHWWHPRAFLVTFQPKAYMHFK